MGIFGFVKKKDAEKVNEALEKYQKEEPESEKQISSEEQTPEVLVGNIQEKRQRLAKRIMEISKRIEDLSIQIYHLQQRVELLEKKLNMRVD